MNLTNLPISILIALAALSIIRVWLHGSIFAEYVAKFEARNDLWGKLYTCPFCLAFYIVFILISAFFIPSRFLQYPFSELLMMPIYLLAAVSLVHILWDWVVKSDNVK